MDHLDRPFSPCKDQYKIAYVCLKPYDGGDFLTYPSRCGLDNTEVLEGDFTRKLSTGQDEPVSISLVQSFLQSWLFFGLLCEVHKVVGRPFNQSDYVSNDSLLIRRNGKGQGLTLGVDTSSLPELLSFWVDSFKQKRSKGELSFESVQQLCSRIDNNLQSVYKICFLLVQSHHTYVDNDLLLSFMCLGNTIDNAMMLVYIRCFYDFLPMSSETAAQIVPRPPGWAPGKRKWDAPHSLFQTLFLFGWCPFDIGILKRDFGINEIIYATQLHRYGGTQRHSECSWTACIANNIDEATYKTRHGTLGVECNKSNCYNVDFQYATLCEIIRSGVTPIIKSEINASGELDFSIIPHSADEIPYVAVSHVWSHGTGNTKSNTLPRCQLEALHKRTVPLLRSFSRLDGPPENADIRNGRLSYFWMDTICVPVQPEDAYLRKMAILRMAQIYEQAHSVMVLDEGLMHTSLRTDDKTVKLIARTSNAPLPPPVRQKDLVMSVIFSDWWRRLWTLQEGMLADILILVFADGSMALNSIVNHGAEEHVRNRADLSSDSVKNGIHDLIDKGHVVGENGIQAIDRTVAKGNLEYRCRVLKLLCNRTTSKASDETICIATLMGLNPQALQNKDPKDRMQMLYTSLGTIPAGVVFLPVPKLETEYFRWAPRSLISIPISLESAHLVLSDEGSEAKVTGSGVRLQAAGYPLVSLDTPLNNNFYIFPGPPGSIPSEEEEVHLTSIDKIRSNNEHIVAILHYDQTAEDEFGDSQTLGVTPWTALREQDLIDPVVILQNPQRIEFAHNRGILVTKAQLLDGFWHARFLCNVKCYRNSIGMWGGTAMSASTLTIKNRLRAERAALAKGTRTGNMAWFQGSEVIKKWCIS